MTKYRIYALAARYMSLRRVSDPDNCNECGTLTVDNIEQHVLCRLECVPYDFTGSLVPLTCGAGQAYFSSIYECVSLDIASLPAFLASFQVTKTCDGGMVTTTAGLENLRFCNTVGAGLTISVTDPSADYTALRDVDAIMGTLELPHYHNADMSIM